MLSHLFDATHDVHTVWDTLAHTDLPIVMYGTGDGADKIINVMETLDIPLTAIFVSDDFYRGQMFRGRQVTTLSALEEQYSDFIIVVAFGSHLPEILERVRQMDQRHPLYIPDVPVYGNQLFDLSFVRQHADELKKTYTLLADDTSRQVFRSVIEYKLTGKLGPLLQATSSKDEVFDRLIPMGSTERYLDLGAYRGDTVAEFLSASGGKYTSITALEPDPRTHKKLAEYMSSLENTTALPYGVSDQNEIAYMKIGRGRGTNRGGDTPIQMVAIDELHTPFSYIKMDVEGSEAAALRGSVYTLQTYKPKLNIACYHRSEDLYQLPLLIHELQPDYKIYMRRHPCLPCWDLNLYCK